MKTNEIKTVSGLVANLRDIRDKLNTDLSKMSNEERSKYFEGLRSKHKSKKLQSSSR